MEDLKDLPGGDGVMESAPGFSAIFDRDGDDSRMSGSPASQKGSISDKTYSPEVMNKANNLEKRVLMLTARAEQNQDVLILDPDTGVIVNENENSSSSSTVYDQLLERKKEEDGMRQNTEELSTHGAVKEVSNDKNEENVSDTKPFSATDGQHLEHIDNVTVVTTDQEHRDHQAVVSHSDVKGEPKSVLSCSYCPRAFTHVGHLKRHMNMHAPDKQLQCDVCGKIFKRTDKFRIHMRIHTGERPHVCFVCDKRFNRAHHLTRHLLIHVRQGVINIDMVKGKGSIKEIVNDQPLPVSRKSDSDELCKEELTGNEDDQVIVATEMLEEDDESSEGEDVGEGITSEQQEEDDNEVVIILSEETDGQGSSLMTASDKFSSSQSGTQHDQSPRRKTKPKKIYNCQHCDKIFDRPSRLITHLSNHILEKGKNGLEEDIEKLEGEENITEDKREFAPPVKATSYACDECGKVFPRQDRLNIHLRIHTGEKPYVCQICERRFSRSHHLSRHILTHSGIKNYRCKFCLKWYSTAYYLKEHMQIRHAEDLAKEGGLANVDFSPQKEPLIMKKEALETKGESQSKFVVSETGELVGKNSESNSGVREFIITENGEIVEGGKDDDFGGSPVDRGSQVLVVVPQESVEIKDLVNRGIPKVMKTPKIFTCEYCGKTFSTSSHLKRHTYNHTGDKPHGCTECGKRFARMDKLRIHYRIHSGERPYSCQLCKKTFARSDLLSRHMFLHPEAISFSSKGDFAEGPNPIEGSEFFVEENGEGSSEMKSGENKLFPFTNLMRREPREKRLHPCLECGKVFPRPSRLAAHLRLHSGEKPYECKECGKKFTRANHLNVHHRIHTGERPHVCQVCNRGFNRSHHLQRHMLIHTGEKPFPCQYCDKRYSRAAHLKDHMLNHHKEIMLAMEGPGGVQGAPFISRLSESQPSMVTEQTDGLKGDTTPGECPVTSCTTGIIVQGDTTSGDVASVRESLDGSNELVGRDLPGDQGLASTCLASTSDFIKKDGQANGTESGNIVNKPGYDGLQMGNDDRLKQARDIKLYPCKHCDMVFNRQSHFERHVLLHDGKKPYECDECGKGFAGKDRLRVHKRIHTGERPYVCTICSKSFGRSHHLKRHLVSHSGVKPFQCEFCDKRYSASYHLKDHMNNHHVLEMAMKHEQQTGKSDALSFVLVNNDHGEVEDNVIREGEEQANDTIDAKDDCGTEFDKGPPLPGLLPVESEQHYADDEDEDASKENGKPSKLKVTRVHQCPHCERIFDRPSRLQSHLYTHTGEKPHTCEECGKSFGGLDRLRVHRRIHTGVKPHVCQICNKAFGRAYHLSRHMMSHSGNKLYQCQFCDKKFTTSSYMKQHQRTTHSLEPGYTSDMEHTSEGQASDGEDTVTFTENMDPSQDEAPESLQVREEHGGPLGDFYDSMNLSDHLLFLVGQEAVKSQGVGQAEEKPATLTPLNDPSSVPVKTLSVKVEGKPAVADNVSANAPDFVSKPEVQKSVEAEEIVQSPILKGSFVCNLCGESCENAGSFFYHREQHRLEGHHMTDTN